MSNLQILLSFLILIAISGPFAWFIVQNKRRITRHFLTERAKSLTQDILAQANSSRRQRWISDSEIEFLYLISGPVKNPNRESLWAYIKITQQAMSARIEYAEDVSRELLLFAEAVKIQLNEAKINACVAVNPSSQPNLSHVGVGEFSR